MRSTVCLLTFQLQEERSVNPLVPELFDDNLTRSELSCDFLQHAVR